ncbi:MAG: hypothetical protein ABEK16_02820 [Candidatus Nanohalobium sp.]
MRKELENSLGREVDVLIYNSVHPNIRERVEEEAVEIRGKYSRDKKRM